MNWYKRQKIVAIGIFYKVHAKPYHSVTSLKEMINGLIIWCTIYLPELKVWLLLHTYCSLCPHVPSMTFAGTKLTRVPCCLKCFLSGMVSSTCWSTLCQITSQTFGYACRVKSSLSSVERDVGLSSFSPLGMVLTSIRYISVVLGQVILYWLCKQKHLTPCNVANVSKMKRLREKKMKGKGVDCPVVLFGTCDTTFDHFWAFRGPGEPTYTNKKP